MPLASLVSGVAEIAIACSAVVGAIVAVRGLNAWKSQQRGNAEYDLALKILTSVFRYRDALEGVRNPAMSNYEMPHPDEEQANKMSHDEIRFFGLAGAYQARWQAVQEQKTTLYAALLEAEVLWGQELKETFERLYKLEHELHNCIRRYLIQSDPNAMQGRKEAAYKFSQKSRDVMYSGFGDSEEDGDVFYADIVAVIQDIEAFLKPKLSYGDV